MTKNTMLGLKSAVVGLFLGAGVGTAQAAVQMAVSNLTSLTGYEIVRASGNAGEYDHVAQSFTTGVAQSYLTRVDFQRVDQSTNNPNFIMSLYADGGSSAPGALITTLSGLTNPVGGDTVNSYTTPTITLSAATTYWIVGGNNSATDAVVWRGATSGYQVDGDGIGWTAGGTGWTINTTPLGSQDNGTSWASLGAYPSLSLAIYADDVPEPEAMAGMLLAGVLGLLGLKRRRRMVIENQV